MTKIKLSQRLRYKFDNTMSKGSGALILWLAILTTVMIVIAAAVILVFSIFPDGDDSSMGVSETLWQTLMRAMDAGTVAGDAGWGFRIVMFIVTIGGIFILSTLIGILSSGIDDKLDELRKGRSFVVEKDHQLVLGWNPKVFTIIDELVEANRNQQKPRIVVMANRDKTMMEDMIREKCPNLYNTKVVCRSGDTTDVGDLAIVNINEAKSIIVLSNEAGPDTDAQTIKTLLATIHHPDRHEHPLHVVAEISEEKNLLAGKIVGKDEVELLLTDDLVSRIMVQTCRQSGLSVVYMEITGFHGDEIYIIEESAVVGQTYGDVLFKYNDSAVCGLQYADGRVQLNPPMETVIEKGAKLVAITEDDDTLIMNAPQVSVDDSAILKGEDEQSGVENTLILSWNKKGSAVVREIASYVAEGSSIQIVSLHQALAINFEDLNNRSQLNIDFKQADPCDREVLESLKLEQYSQIIVLSNDQKADIQQSDSQTLITLLHLRDILDSKNANVRVVSEIMDVRNRELASVTRADDFVMSDKLVSQMVSQVSETKDIVKVFNDMFDADGSEIYLKPISNFVKPGVAVDFFTVLESAKRQGHTAIGYRLMKHQYNKQLHYGIVVNPVKSNKITFEEGDKIIVVAED